MVPPDFSIWTKHSFSLHPSGEGESERDTVRLSTASGNLTGGRLWSGVAEHGQFTNGEGFDGRADAIVTDRPDARVPARGEDLAHHRCTHPALARPHPAARERLRLIGSETAVGDDAVDFGYAHFLATTDRHFGVARTEHRLVRLEGDVQELPESPVPASDAWCGRASASRLRESIVPSRRAASSAATRPDSSAASAPRIPAPSPATSTPPSLVAPHSSREGGRRAAARPIRARCPPRG